MANLRHETIYIMGRETRPPRNATVMLVCKHDDSVFHAGPAMLDRSFYTTGDAYTLTKSGIRMSMKIKVIAWWRSVEENYNAQK